VTYIAKTRGTPGEKFEFYSLMEALQWVLEEVHENTWKDFSSRNQHNPSLDGRDMDDWRWTIQDLEGNIIWEEPDE